MPVAMNPNLKPMPFKNLRDSERICCREPPSFLRVLMACIGKTNDDALYNSHQAFSHASGRGAVGTGGRTGV